MSSSWSDLTAAQKFAILSDSSGLDHIHPDPKEDSTWIGAYRLGGGSFGQVTTWICVDGATRRPIKNVAIKDTWDADSTEEKGTYSNVYNSLVAKGMDFGADPGAALGKANIDKRFQKEAYLQGIMTEPSSNQEIYSVPLWGYRRRPESVRPGYNQWRLYMPLYEYGDLHQVIVAHRIHQRGIPEPFIWHTFRCLLTGAEQLTEQVRKRQGSDKDDVIIVFDMKPDNILLAPPNQTSTFPIYPRAHIADLGGGCITNPNDEDNRTGRLICQMTRGYIPPELLRSSAFGNERYAIGEWTNIWQIGRVIKAMMKLASNLRQLNYSVTDREPKIMNWQGQFPGQSYSSRLRAAVDACLRFRPDHRTTVAKLLNLIDNIPSWRVHQRDMRTFGSDAWFEEQERQQQQAATTAPANTTPSTPSDVAAEQNASSRKRKRMEDANHYLRTWSKAKAARFNELGVLPNEAYDLEYPEQNLFWAKDDFSLVHSDGKPVYPLAYQPKGHTASIGFSGLKIGSSAPAGEGDVDVSMQDNLDEDDDGNSTAKANQSTIKANQSTIKANQSTIKANQGGHGGHGAYHPDPGASPWISPHPASKSVDEGGKEDEDGEEDDNGEDGSQHKYSSEPLMFHLSMDAPAAPEGGEGGNQRADDEHEGIEEQEVVDDRVEEDEGEYGEGDEDDDDDADHHRSSVISALPSPPQDDSYHSSDVPWLLGADDLADDDEQEDIDEQAGDDEQAEDDEQEDIDEQAEVDERAEVDALAEVDVDSDEDDVSVHYTASTDLPPYSPEDRDVLRDEDSDDEPEEWTSTNDGPVGCRQS